MQSYQTEGTQNGETYVSEGYFDEAENDYDEIETIPGVGEVEFRSQSHRFQEGLQWEGDCEKLDGRSSVSRDIARCWCMNIRKTWQITARVYK